MKIKDRLSLYFTLSTTIILVAVLSAVYFTFVKFMESDFFDRLTDRTMVTAKLYLEADEISPEALDKVRNQYLVTLNSEVIRIYNSKNGAAFIGDDQQYWTAATINKVRQQKKIKYREGDRQVVGIFYKDNQGDFVILASAVDSSTLNRIEKLKRIMIVIFAAIFIVLLFLGRWIARRVLKPLDLFIGEVAQIKSSNLHFRVQEGQNKDEINLLAQNFNSLMEHLEQAFVLQKTFIANASHELRTPVTRMMMTAELSLSQERKPEAYREALSSVMEDAGNMDSIISSLLNLAQADLEFGAQELAPLRIDELLWTLATEWQKKGNTLNVSIDNMPETADALLVQVNAPLLLIAINNIISNAFKFSDQQPVDCMLQVNEKKGELTIAITDKGPGIDASVLPEIYEPFFSASKDSGHAGNGMGLYMAHKIITLFRGTLDVSTNPGSGSTFIVTLPQLRAH
ncbi:two-component system sensor histidine kinase [Pedobacter sp. BAL39]|uniref:sensor histidine kinase n=1 Tax=Pedobacter sp. BAL39 TaxID=391596 RepID=UPI000155955E|nr:HAMP domain-containing sensor histidine kinase [Pedobacter sp. BAL39]EDM35408.1 two-component system sensor histidine kinase [Pedobacter sp. BAL39]